MQNADPIVIASAARTAIGDLLGQFTPVPSPKLGAAAIEGALTRANNMDKHLVNEVMMGCVLSAGLGQAPARQASIYAGIPESVPCTTINKMCGSGMQAVIIAHDSIVVGRNHIVVAGGQENMSAAPYLIPGARQGFRFGHQHIQDHMLLDGLEDAYDAGKPMGYFAEMTVRQYGYTRQAQDAFAIESLSRAQRAIQHGDFVAEIVPVEIRVKSEVREIMTDEHPNKVKIDKVPTLSPVFMKDGTITAASSSAISDGAAALLLMRESKANALGIQPLAKICGFSTAAQAPAWFTTTPVIAINLLLQRCQWQVDDVDLFEINEAFAVVAMHAIRECKLDPATVNVNGGACALGHPIGATGARIMTTLLYALKQRKLKRGVAALCIGGGEATAVGIELY